MLRRTPKTLVTTISTLLLVAPLALGCDKGRGTDAEKAPEVSGPCADAAALSGVVMLKLEDTPDDAKAGIALVNKVRAELAAACKDKGLDKTEEAALACFKKNEKAVGYRILSACEKDRKTAQALIDAVVAKHGGTVTPAGDADETASSAGEDEGAKAHAKDDDTAKPKGTGTTKPAAKPASTAAKPAPPPKPKSCNCPKGDLMCNMRCSQR